MSFPWGGELNGLALCAGFGGLERGLESVIDGYRTVCYVEGETYPAAVLASKMEKGQILKAPIWSNVRTFEGERWRGKVDLLSGGFPCQPYSQAGKQLADKDPRDLWPDFSRIIGEVRPRIIFLENVPNVVKWALPTVLKDLSQMGYNAAWCVIAASDVGAPHQRKRWFLLAHANRQRTKRHRVKLESGEVLKRHPNPKGFKSGGASTWWQIEPSMGRMVDGVAHWVHRIRGCGNGVVPQQAEYAFRLLNEQLGAVE